MSTSLHTIAADVQDRIARALPDGWTVTASPWDPCTQFVCRQGVPWWATSERLIALVDTRKWGWKGRKPHGPYKGRGWRDRLVADVVAAVGEVSGA